MTVVQGWFSVSGYGLPPDEFPVLILVRGVRRIAKLRQLTNEVRYWSDPEDGDCCWLLPDVTHWAWLPEALNVLNNGGSTANGLFNPPEQPVAPENTAGTCCSADNPHDGVVPDTGQHWVLAKLEWQPVPNASGVFKVWMEPLEKKG